MKRTFVALTLLSSCLVLQAQTMTGEQRDAAEDRIEADSKMAKANCEVLRANAKDVCEKQADAQEKIAKAELENRYKPSISNSRKLEQVRAEVAYDVAKERCEDLRGDAQDQCERTAKSEYERAEAASRR